MTTPLNYLQQQTQANWLIGYSSQDVLSLAEHLIAEGLSAQSNHRDRPLKILLAHRDPVQFLAHFIAACSVPTHLFLCNPDWAEAEWQQVVERVQPDLVWQEESGQWTVDSGQWAGDRRQETGDRLPRTSADGRQEAEGRRQKAEGMSHSLLHSPTPLLLHPPTHPPIHPSTPPTPPLPTPHIPNSRPPIPDTRHPAPRIHIPTGGSSGQIRFVIHTWDTLMASVRGFQRYFEVEQVNCCCVLPLYHVSGLMQVMRSLTSGGQLLILPFKTFESDPIPPFNPETFFLSLVPTQLHRLLEPRRSTETSLPSIPLTICRDAINRVSTTHPPIYPSTVRLSAHSEAHPPTHLLPHFKAILLGGAPAWPELLHQARELRLPLAPTYGMTETASQIATLKPADFLQGKTGAGQILPHARIEICNQVGDRLPPNHPGHIHIRSQSLTLGYYIPLPPTDAIHPDEETFHRNVSTPIPNPQSPIPDPQSPIPNPQSPIPDPRSPIPDPQSPPFTPDDIGYLDADGYLHLLGRHSDKIITGGENVYPAEVEAAIRATGLVQDVCVLGVRDRLWGQAIVAIYSPVEPTIEAASIKAALQNRLSRFKHPKHWVAVESLPRNAQGKINQASLRVWVADHSPALAEALPHTETTSE